uniref:Uncharacterized protein n=1 Tax=Anguilla anguilla TaxID=7936 RepID=A0A0E9W5G0_ANGAN
MTQFEIQYRPLWSIGYDITVYKKYNAPTYVQTTDTTGHPLFTQSILRMKRIWRQVRWIGTQF